MTADKGQLIAQLTERLQNIPPLDGEDFITIETITRYLKSTQWDIEAAEKTLLETIEWRRRTNPKDIDCSWCHDRPGYHNMRQVGFDEIGRPVIYACIAQASSRKNTVDDVIAHVTYVMENARHTMSPGISSWTFVIDCTGMTLQACNPKLGYGTLQELAKHYPERLGQVIVIKPNALFRAVWKPLKHFLDVATVKKLIMVKKRDRLLETFQTVLPDELCHWLVEEISLNRIKPLPQGQREFWKAPEESASAHDPRGCPSFVLDYIESRDCSASAHKPHPNIVDCLKGKSLQIVLSDVSLCDKDNSVTNGDDSDSEDTVEIGDEFRIPEDAQKLI